MAAQLRRCLYTGDPLTSRQNVEHAIPWAIGGGLTSRVTISSAFNHAAGDSIDRTLSEAWTSLIVLLSPAMSVIHLPFHESATLSGQFLSDLNRRSGSLSI